MPLAVRLRSAVSLLGRFPALAGVDLDVAAGEIVLVRGANGAGKTTLLRACAGLAAFASGEAEVLGHDLRKDRKAVRRRIGLLGHATFLYDDLTVADNLTFSARSAGADAASAAERHGPPRSRRPPARRPGRQALGRPAPPGRPRRRRRPPSRPVAARRAPRRPRRRRPRPARRHRAGRRGGRAPPSSSPPTSSTGPRPSPPARSSWPAASGHRRPAGDGSPVHVA